MSPLRGVIIDLLGYVLSSLKSSLKLYANRLVVVLPKIILDKQSGFIPGRFIDDNILLAQEMIHCLDEKTCGSNVILKFDIMKAYDKLDWGFLFEMLSCFGFDTSRILKVSKLSLIVGFLLS